MSTSVTYLTQSPGVGASTHSVSATTTAFEGPTTLSAAYSITGANSPIGSATRSSVNTSIPTATSTATLDAASSRIGGTPVSETGVNSLAVGLGVGLSAAAVLSFIVSRSTPFAEERVIWALVKRKGLDGGIVSDTPGLTGMHGLGLCTLFSQATSQQDTTQDRGSEPGGQIGHSEFSHRRLSKHNYLAK